MRSLLTNKKGNIFGLAFILIITFIVAFVGLIVFILSWNISNAYAEMDIVQEQEITKEVVTTFRNRQSYIYDGFVLFMFLGTTIGLMIAATRTDFNPVIIFLFLILLAITVLTAAGFVDIYQGLAGDAAFADVQGSLTFTNIIFSQYTPLFFAVLGTIILIIMYGKSGGDIIR